MAHIDEPLAYRMRPKNIDEVVGQEHLVGEGKIIRRMLEAEMLSSMILYGPPGTGKTSIASAIAGTAGKPMRTMNAATDSKKRLQIIGEETNIAGTIVLFLDEIHRLDKAKQDFLLPLVEKGKIILIGATTENPYITINPAIRSRAQIFEVTKLDPKDIETAIMRALKDKENGLGELKITIDDGSINHLSTATGGDLRAALNGLELAVKSTHAQDDGTILITTADTEECLQRKAFSHDKDGDSHYDVMSALQKSIRGSDVDGALHYLARMIEAGELPTIVRRLTVTAYEDIGLAAPDAVAQAVTAINTAQTIGFPEAQIPLSNAVILLALSPKSNTAYKAISAARKDIKMKYTGEVPAHLKDSHYKGAQTLGRGVSYMYPHNFPQGWVSQQYLPDPIKDAVYWKGKESSANERKLIAIRKKLDNK